MAMNPNLFRRLTFLPVEMIRFPNKVECELKITTPHRGEVTIIVSPEGFGIFERYFEYNEHTVEILKQLRRLERESVI